MPEITKELREQLRAEWVEALESGKYQQAENALRRGDSYCCLGVACEVYLRHFPQGVTVKHSRGTDGGCYAYDGKTGSLPETVQNAFGMKEEDGEYKTDDSYGTLAGLNDIGKPFPEIAAVIRSRPPGLFVD